MERDSIPRHQATGRDRGEEEKLEREIHNEGEMHKKRER